MTEHEAQTLADSIKAFYGVEAAVYPMECRYIVVVNGSIRFDYPWQWLMYMDSVWLRAKNEPLAESFR